MSITRVAIDPKPISGRRAICTAVAVSLCCHLFLLVFFIPSDETLGEHPDQPSTRYSISLRQTPVVQRPRASKVPLEEVQVASRRVPGLPLKAQTGKPLPEVRVDEAAILRALTSPSGQTINPPALTDNGAALVDSALAAQLNQAPRRKGFVPEELHAGLGGSFGGGAWTDYLRMGDDCFQVVQADPLDSLSTETWYRVRCRP